jgi:hypothetical protein
MDRARGRTHRHGLVGDEIGGRVGRNTEKSAVSPGPLATSRELLGEMLLEMNQPAEALLQFEAALKREPKRFRALYGAARAAQLKPDPETRRRYFDELIIVCAHADKPGRKELAEVALSK